MLTKVKRGKSALTLTLRFLISPNDIILKLIHLPLRYFLDGKDLFLQF